MLLETYVDGLALRQFLFEVTHKKGNLMAETVHGNCEIVNLADVNAVLVSNKLIHKRYGRSFMPSERNSLIGYRKGVSDYLLKGVSDY